MVALDQDIRNKLLEDIGNQELAAQMSEADRRHTARLRQMVAAHGWPGTSLVGEDGAHAAWLLVQHADHDPAFQQECLDRMTAAGPGEVNRKNVAYLVDRVRVNTSQPQRYGTQFWTDADGVFGPRPMEDAERVDELRSEMGLSPFEEYEQTMMQLHLNAERTR